MLSNAIIAGMAKETISSKLLIYIYRITIDIRVGYAVLGARAPEFSPSSRKSSGFPTNVQEEIMMRSIIYLAGFASLALPVADPPAFAQSK